MKRRISKKGFTLVELMLVIGIGLGISFLSFQGLIKQQEQTQGNIVGQQLSQVGTAVNNYVANHYDTLSSLTNATGSVSDPGPRTCTTANSTCTITIQTLINEGYLPSTYGSTNIYGAGYNIFLKRTGTSPYYNVTGIVLTSKPWITGTGTAIRYDLLGKAMQTAGIDSAMTRSSPTVLEGYKGNWNNTSTDFSAINQQGLLGYQVGFGSNSYSLFLRRDGTLPMTGSLNMGANDINNAKNINASGTVTAGGAGVFGGEVTATNGYGDKITLGGDAVSNDYELRLGSNKQFTIYSPNATQYSTVLSVNRNAIISERLSTNGLDPNDVPTGWGGGLRSNDVLATATVGVVPYGKTGASLGGTTELASYMDRFGNIYGSNSISSGGNITAKGLIATNGLDPSDLPPGWTGGIRTYDIFASSLIGVGANKKYTAYMSANGSIYASGDLKVDKTISSTGNISSAAQITSGSRLTTNEFLQINGVAALNGACSPNGVFGRDSAGSPLVCVSGSWKKGAFSFSYYSVSFASPTAGSGDQVYQRTNMGSHMFCMISGSQTGSGLTKHLVVYLSGSSWILEQRPTEWPAGINTWGQAICMD